MALRDDFEPANRRAKNLQATIPKAVSVHYDRKKEQIVIDLSSKLTVSFFRRTMPQGLPMRSLRSLRRLRSLHRDEGSCQHTNGCDLTRILCIH